MATARRLAERVERLVLRHEELKRTIALFEQQLAAVTAERDSLRSRLAAARARIDALLERLPADDDGRGRSGARTRMKQIEVTDPGPELLLGCPEGGEARCWKRSPRSTAR